MSFPYYGDGSPSYESPKVRIYHLPKKGIARITCLFYDPLLIKLH